VRVDKEQAPVSDLIADLARELLTLATQELSLAQLEFRQKFGQLIGGIALIAAGGIVAYAGFLALIAGLVIVLAHFVALWVAALVVGLAVVGAGYLLLNTGLERLREVDVVPHHTIQTLKEDAEWLKAVSR